MPAYPEKVRSPGQTGSRRGPVQPTRMTPKRTLVGPCGRLAKSFLDKSDLVAQAGFGVFAVLDAALDQDRLDPQPSEYDRSWQGSRCWFIRRPRRRQRRNSQSQRRTSAL